MCLGVVLYLDVEFEMREERIESHNELSIDTHNKFKRGG
jgi:hypothetical protein